MNNNQCIELVINVQSRGLKLMIQLFCVKQYRHFGCVEDILLFYLIKCHNRMTNLIITIVSQEKNVNTRVLISPQPDLLSDVFCLMVRIFRLMLVLLYIYINSTNISPIMIINRIYETQNLLWLQLVSFLVGLRTYQHPCIS